MFFPLMIGSKEWWQDIVAIWSGDLKKERIQREGGRGGKKPGPKK